MATYHLDILVDLPRGLGLGVRPRVYLETVCVFGLKLLCVSSIVSACTLNLWILLACHCAKLLVAIMLISWMSGWCLKGGRRGKEH